MLQDVCRKYYFEQDLNCAETVLLAAGEYFGLADVNEGSVRGLGAFGSGCGCGKLCGAVAASVAALGMALTKERAHTSPELRKATAEYMRTFIAQHGSDQCRELRAKYYSKEQKCFAQVALAADLLEEIMEKYGVHPV